MLTLDYRSRIIFVFNILRNFLMIVQKIQCSSKKYLFILDTAYYLPNNLYPCGIEFAKT